MNEQQMMALLKQRYTQKAGNGDAWAFVPKVRDKAGFDAGRTIDAVAMSLWPSRGLMIHGFEIKCSRADWLREMRNPEKAEVFGPLLDRFWLVVADRAIVLDGELPDSWGLLAVRGKGGLVCVREAPKLTSSTFELRHRHFLASLLRSSLRESIAPVELDAARDEGAASERMHWEGRLAAAEREAKRMLDREDALTKALGVSPYSLAYVDIQKIASAFRVALRGDDQVEQLEKRLVQLKQSAQMIIDAVGRINEPE